MMLGAATLFAWSTVAGAEPAASELADVALLSDAATIPPGGTIALGIRIAPIPGWHTYWQNPGDAGMPSTVDWKLPDGFTAEPLAWPRPERIVANGITSYGYEKPVLLSSRIAVPPTLDQTRPVTIDAHVSFLVCAEICVPVETDVSTVLPVGGGGAATPAAAASFAAARASLPAPLRGEARFSVGERDILLTVPADALGASVKRLAEIAFFPLDGATIDHGAAQHATIADGMVALRMVRSPALLAAPATLGGVLAFGADGPAFAIDANPGAVSVAEGGVLEALALAFLGGLVLNLMPCVLPILSLKVLGIVAHAHRSRRALLAEAAAYGLGILVSFAALAGVLLTLRAGGAAVGWGFQLQSPGFVTVLAYLLFAMGLGLSGVLPLGGASIAGLGGGLAGRGGLGGSFATGILATLVATPCTAPFMGAALGIALAAPPATALGIFLMLGVGFAFPYLAVSAVPGLARLLPRPGAWMVTLKQALAFPLYATVAWLVWVLSAETGSTGLLAALLGLVAIAVGAWLLGRPRPGRRTLRLARGLAAATAGAAALWLAALATVDKPVAEATAAPRGPEALRDLATAAYSRDRLDAALAAGRPVFVNLTAAWCITCLVNEKTTLAADTIREAFARHDVLYLKGDWTNQDSEITALLQRFGRSGVPLYLFYRPDAAPEILPQILTQAALLDRLKDLPTSSPPPARG